MTGGMNNRFDHESQDGLEWRGHRRVDEAVVCLSRAMIPLFDALKKEGASEALEHVRQNFHEVLLFYRRCSDKKWEMYVRLTSGTDRDQVRKDQKKSRASFHAMMRQISRLERQKRTKRPTRKKRRRRGTRRRT